MTELHFPWLESAVLLPLAGSVWVRRWGDSERGRRCWLFFAGLTFVLTVGAWADFELLHATEAHDCWEFSRLFGLQKPVLVIDQLSAPLLPWLSLLFFLTAIVTLQAKVRRFSFSWKLIYESIVLAIFSCKEPWILIALLCLGTLPPFLELRARGKPTRVFALHMLLYIGLLVVGEMCIDHESGRRVHTLWATLPLLGAVLVRCGIFPFHIWVTDLFEHATLGTALLFVTPIAGAYAAVRLVLPIAPDWVLHGMGLLSLVTAVYASGMALIQRDGRRFFCYLFLSHAALVLVGLEMATSIGLTGALCVWLSVGLSLGGFGLTLRAVEARRGRLSLGGFQGLYEHTPSLAMCFVLTGLASVGFPGTFGFVGMEILVDGATLSYPYVGIAVVVAAAINGIAVVQAYFYLFTGTRYTSSVPLWMRARERYAVLTLAALILAGGFYPQPGVASRHRAAAEILQQREHLGTDGSQGVSGRSAPDDRPLPDPSAAREPLAPAQPAAPPSVPGRLAARPQSAPRVCCSSAGEAFQPIMSHRCSGDQSIEYDRCAYAEFAPRLTGSKSNWAAELTTLSRSDCSWLRKSASVRARVTSDEWMAICTSAPSTCHSGAAREFLPGPQSVISR